MCPVWGFCECGNGLHRSIKDTSYTVTRPGTVFCAVRHDVLAQVLMQITPCLLKGYGRFGGTQCLHLGLLALKMKVNWPVNKSQRPRWLWSAQTPLWKFPEHQLVSKRRQKTNRRCVKSQKTADLIYTAFEAWNHATVEVLRFPLSACQDNAQTEVGGVCCLCCSRLSHNW
jgi:hypothetical protein